MWWNKIRNLILMASLLAAVGCMEIPDHSLCASGFICPPSLRCAAAQDVCIAGPCGDGVIDSFAGETCDDGNLEPGDGCDQECSFETICGNGLVEAGEECDDGGENTLSCNGNCTRTACGDGWWNPRAGEECDDGNMEGAPICVACKLSRVLALGGSHTCLLSNDGAIRCWGSGNQGQLGYGNTTDIGDDETPASAGNVDVGGSAIQIAAGSLHTCALLDSGAVRCWGYGYGGRIGYGNPDIIGDDETPALAGNVDVGGSVAQIAASGVHTCALLDSGTVRCWGLGDSGRLGYGNTNNIGDDEVPASAGDVDVGGAVTQIATGGAHTCVLLDSGTVRCWGLGGSGRLGYGNTNNIGDDETPASAGDVDVGGTVIQLAAGGAHTCALLDSGTVRCWGDGYAGQLGYGNTNSIGDDEAPSSARDVDVGGTAVQLVAGFAHTCALLDTGTVHCWGSGDLGKLGYGDTNTIGDNETPASTDNVDVGGAVLQLAAGFSHACALVDTGAIRCWGDGSFGRLGYGNTNIIGDDEIPASAGDVDVGGSVINSLARLAAGATNCPSISP